MSILEEKITYPQPEVEFTASSWELPQRVEHAAGTPPPREGEGVRIAITKYGEALERLADAPDS
jgi:hypothetical protein